MWSDEFVKKHAEDRMQNEQKLLAELPHLRDPQSAWALLSLSAAQKANHTIRVLPPTLSRTYAEGHDGAIWDAFCEILGASELRSDSLARSVATLPAHKGGHGLRSASRF